MLGAPMTADDGARARDIVLLGPDGHGRGALRRALARLLPPSDPGPAPGPQALRAPRPEHEITEIRAGGVLLRLWDCAQEDWYRLVLGEGPRGAAALLVFSVAAEIGPETGEAIEAQLALLRDLGETPLVVFMHGIEEAAARSGAAAQLARAERALRDLVASDDPSEEIPILRGAPAGSEGEAGALLALGEQLARSSAAPGAPIAAPGPPRAHRDLGAWIVALARDRCLSPSPGLPLRCRRGDAETPARLLGASSWDRLPCGQAIKVQLSLEEPLPLSRLDPIELLDGAGRVIAQGRVTDL
jgi:hypothetical protein